MPIDLLTLLSPNNLVLFIIVFTRLTGMMTGAPLFATYPIPMNVKVVLCAIVSFLIFPVVSANVGVQVPKDILMLSLFLVKEFFIGFLIGYIDLSK